MKSIPHVACALTFCVVGLLTCHAGIALPDHGGDQPVGVLSTNRPVSDKAMPSPNVPLKLQLELSDGTRLIGTPQIESLPFHTSFADINVALKLIDSIEISKESGAARVVFVNGDKLEGSLKATEIVVETLFGRHTVPLKLVLKIGVSAGGSGIVVIPKGLVLYFSFDGNEGSRVTDRSGKGNHGKMEGAKWTAEGRKGGGLHLDGKNDYIRVGNPATLQITGPFTMAAWFRPSDVSSVRRIVAKHKTPGNWGYQFFIQNSRLSFGLSNSGSGWTQFNGNTVLEPGAWYHGVAVYDGERMTTYLNGVLDCTPIRYSGGVYNSEAEFLIGNGTDMEPEVFFAGELDDIRIYDRVLTEQEIEKLVGSFGVTP